MASSSICLLLSCLPCAQVKIPLDVTMAQVKILKLGMLGPSAGVGYQCLHVLYRPAAALGHAMMVLGGRCLIWRTMGSPAGPAMQALGISVEFCAHVLHAFVVAPGTRRERMASAVTDVGASVLSGITLTKFVGKHQQHPISVFRPQLTYDMPSWACSTGFLSCACVVHTVALLIDSFNRPESSTVPT